MRFIDRVKSLFRRGGAKVGMVSTLETILDHPKINGDKKEYTRIKRSLMYYEGAHPKIKYKNSNKNMVEREPSTINMLKKVANRYASVVFNEQCEIEVDGPAAEFIGAVFERNDFKKNFSKYLEPMFALGGLACRPYLDTGTNQIDSICSPKTSCSSRCFAGQGTANCIRRVCQDAAKLQINCRFEGQPNRCFCAGLVHPHDRQPWFCRAAGSVLAMSASSA